ncbi:MAG: PilZ domain-containing protein [Desulfosarcina sp.]|nr:PilZ domain-containing protein [Desulfobacterales bacterium]
MNKSAHLQNSIVSQIIDGSITIDSIGEYQSMLKIFPDNPYLHRALADLLIRRRSFATAADYYDKTATLFSQSGMVLQAVVAKMLQWQIVKPHLKAIKHFYHDLLAKNPRTTPLKMFFAGLSFHELTTIITRLERFVLPPGKVVKKFGDVEANLYMVVSGTLIRRTYSRSNQLAPKEQLVETPEQEVFGEIYPLDAEHLSPSYTETTSRVELAKLTRENLIDICVHYPSIAPALKELFENLSKLTANRPVKRRPRRHSIPVRIRLEILHVQDRLPRFAAIGFVRDLSIGGACIILDDPVDARLANQLIDKEARILMSLPNEAMALNIRGNVVWSRNLVSDGEAAHALGIQFHPMPPNLSGLLLVFADNLYHAS